MREHHQGKILKRGHLQVEKENLEEGISSSGVKVLVWFHQAEIVILLLGPVKEYNTQVRVGT